MARKKNTPAVETPTPNETETQPMPDTSPVSEPATETVAAAEPVTDKKPRKPKTPKPPKAAPALVAIEDPGFATLEDVGDEMADEETIDIDPRGIVFPKFDSRAEDGEIDAGFLADIKINGILQSPLLAPLKERGPSGELRYAVVAGRRRVRAAIQLGLSFVRCKAKILTFEAAFTAAFSENFQRKNLTAYDEAVSIRQMMDTFNLKGQEVAERLSCTPGRISQLLGIFKLDPRVQNLVRKDLLGLNHARSLQRLTDLDQQVDIATRATEDHNNIWSTAELEHAVVSTLDQNKKKAEAKAAREAEKAARDAAKTEGGSEAAESAAEEAEVSGPSPVGTHYEVDTFHVRGHQTLGALLEYAVYEAEQAKQLVSETDEHKRLKEKAVTRAQAMLAAFEMVAGVKALPKSVRAVAAAESEGEEPEGAEEEAEEEALD